MLRVPLLKCKMQVLRSQPSCMKAYQLGWDSKGGRSGTLKRKRINTKVLRGMHSSPTEKKKTTLGELSEAAVCSKNNGACSFAQVSFFFLFFLFPFLLFFPSIDNRRNGASICYCKNVEIWQVQKG